MSKDLKGSITISRVTSGKGDYISVSIRDEASRNRFVTAKLSLEDYGWLVSGMSEVKCKLETKGLAHVGKVRIRKERTLTIRGIIYDKDECLAAIRLHEKAMIEGGWYVTEYLGSRSSVSHYDGLTKLNYEIFKYVEEDDVNSHS